MALSIPLARVVVDRDADARDRGVEALLAEPGTLVLPLWRSRALLAERVDGSPAALDLRPASAFTPTAPEAAATGIHLGIRDGHRIVAVVLDDAAAVAVEPEEQRWAGLRALTSLLDDGDAALAAEAVAVANWHDSHRHCPRCGAPTEVRQSGWVRHCPVEGVEIFPRTDPAVIVLITDHEDRALLGSNASWAPGRYSLLAGFVEPGESLEHAVVREMKEESGLDVVDPVYRGSQPWPFPASIMLGFTATLPDAAARDALRPDGAEILDLRWFSRDDIRTATDIVLPGSGSIARALLEDWFGGPITDGEVRW